MSFFKKIKMWFHEEPKEIVAEEIRLPEIPTLEAVFVTEKKQYFNDLMHNSEVASLFIKEAIPNGALPVYDLDGGEKEIITIDDGKPVYMKTERTKIILQLQENMTANSIINCLLLAAKYAQPLHNVEQYGSTDGWVTVSGNKLENRLHKNIYIKDFPKTLFLPQPEFLGVICQCSAQGIVEGFGFFMILEKVRVL